MFHQQKDENMENLGIYITNILAKYQLESAVLKSMKSGLLFTSCKYLEVKKFEWKSDVDIEYGKILKKVKVHKRSVKLQQETYALGSNEPQMFTSIDAIKKSSHKSFQSRKCGQPHINPGKCTAYR